MKEINGIICAMVTPMDSYGNIHEPGIRQLTERSIQCGVHGLFTIGTTGEFYAMTTEEKLRVTKIVIEQAAGRVPVYAGCGAESTREVIDLIQKMEAIGVDAVSVVTPYFITPSQVELYNHYEAIAKSTKLPVIIYNIPSRAGVNIDASTVRELAKIHNIAGIKDSSGKIDNIKAYIDATKGENFSVLAGTDSLILAALELGAKGAIAATANVVPQVVVGIYESFMKGDAKAALDFQKKLVPLRSAFSMGTIPSILKEATNLIGINAGPPRSPLMRPDPEKQKILSAMIEEEYGCYKATLSCEVFAKDKKKETLRSLLENTKIPRMVKIRQKFLDNSIADVAAEVKKKLENQNLEQRIKPGMSVAVTGSSRGIANMNVILRETVAFLKKHGANPFIIPAMGSHGGSTAKGQREILEGYGITEEFCGCPIKSSMETVEVGKTRENLTVLIDKYAYEADGIVVVNRIKPHTAFRGTYESGLMKMLTIGLGKQKGADSLHEGGFKYFPTRIPDFAHVVLEKTNVLFGVATIENAFDKTCRIEVMPSEDIPKREPELLKFAFSHMPRILFDETDVLVVGKIGKNYSGSGMDPNVTGTWSTPYGSGGIKKQRVCVLDLDESSHGNAIGIGMADTTTKKFYRKMDFGATYPNALTSTVIQPCKIPMVLDDDEMAIKGAIKTCNEIDKNSPRVIMIKNTLSLEEIYVSEVYLEQIKGMDNVEVISGPEYLTFDEDGNVIW